MTAPDPSREPVTTYWQAQDAHRTTSEACKRFDQLASRDLTARALAMLKARGTYDPGKHADASKYPPLTADEHLELLATGEMLARHYRHPAHLHDAVRAGVTWPQVAQAVGADEAHVRQQYREWADGQHRLHTWYQGKFGLNDADYTTALQRASEPADGPQNEHEAGQ